MNPFSARIARKVHVLVTSIVIPRVEEAVRIAHLNPPDFRLGGGRINRKSDLPPPVEFGLVLVRVRHSVREDRHPSV
jgi:hypothetical protein